MLRPQPNRKPFPKNDGCFCAVTSQAARKNFVGLDFRWMLTSFRAVRCRLVVVVVSVKEGPHTNSGTR